MESRCPRAVGQGQALHSKGASGVRVQGEVSFVLHAEGGTVDPDPCRQGHSDLTSCAHQQQAAKEQMKL